MSNLRLAGQAAAPRCQSFVSAVRVHLLGCDPPLGSRPGEVGSRRVGGDEEGRDHPERGMTERAAPSAASTRRKDKGER